MRSLYKKYLRWDLHSPSTTDDLINISDHFAALWNLAHCIGAIDG